MIKLFSHEHIASSPASTSTSCLHIILDLPLSLDNPGRDYAAQWTETEENKGDYTGKHTCAMMWSEQILNTSLEGVGVDADVGELPPLQLLLARHQVLEASQNEPANISNSPVASPVLPEQSATPAKSRSIAEKTLVIFMSKSSVCSNLTVVEDNNCRVSDWLVSGSTDQQFDPGCPPPMRIVATDFPADDGAPHVRPAPIGHPIKISQVLKQPMPPGRVARLIIDGEGDTEGYLSCPAETADSFIECAAV
ncbi:uncharacterized protein PHACADRAFT_202384 [Phanerochaete carnosa HHB-10118-sp]|uniref:Uncharacterized protein n=1 Tax=Phanerochaete carnosa (strain HHB-10118-sp) TaxID=650164 RepID=K5VQG6_PHACS|nr:uncharacterized protein PHACADRAFT_202384 [Phanerochaete carnosa HHB-10118-sp]EKM48794.1 hypothetical protein PHACADRAFT_202384 [Phanerochaete carnosa HHB-10118-sp]